MTEQVKDKKQLKAERKAAALAKKEAIANGTWVEPNAPKVTKEQLEEEQLVDDSVHLLHVYSSQAGCMAEWIKHAHKPEGTETLFYSFNAIQPLLKTLRSVEDYRFEYIRLLALQVENDTLILENTKLVNSFRMNLIWNRYEHARLTRELISMKFRRVSLEQHLNKVIEKMFIFCEDVKAHVETL